MKSKEPRIIWLKSWRDFPSEHIDGSVKARSYPEENVIFAFKDKTSQVNIQHEIGHIKLKHKDNNPRNPRTFVRQELEATLYAYEQIKKPTHILEQLRAIYNDIIINIYKVPPVEAKKILREELYDIDPPETWLKDYHKLYGEYKIARKEGRL